MHPTRTLWSSPSSLLLALLCSATVGAFDLPSDSISLDLPTGWEAETSKPPVLLMCHTPAESASVAASAYKNLAITRQDMRPDLKTLYLKDPRFFLQVTLLQTFTTLSINQIVDRSIGGYKGVLIFGTLKEAQAAVSNMQFYFLVGNRLYTIVYSCQTQNWDKSWPTFEKSLSSLRKLKK
jgi:hypothetical protein